jgi:phosphatidylserine/phosphatidylglycerophosphate/cardiolipin synthase-like enzyme
VEGAHNVTTLDDWFLTASERGNPDTHLDDRHRDDRAYSTGNSVRVFVDGADYFRVLYDALHTLEPGDAVWFTDWRGDADELLVSSGTEVGRVLASLARRGVDVRGLIWRSHSDHAHFSADENRDFVDMINCAGGEALLDERVHRAGSHHQKMVILHPKGGEMTVFLGGIDLSHGRHDDHDHQGDAQVVEIDERYGSRPAWHDAHISLVGPATLDVAMTFRERWSDPTPLDLRPRSMRGVDRSDRLPRYARPLPPSPSAAPSDDGTHAVQVLRTYPARRSPYPFARAGERSVARAYLKAFARARVLVYIEDQYLWSMEAARSLARALHRSPDLRVIAVVPRVPDRNGLLSGPSFRVGQERAIDLVKRAGGDRVAVYDLENERQCPIYVHAKVCVVDDVWLEVGSDNLNRRSWTNDSEASCAIIDETIDGRAPRDPGGIGDGARRLARETRLRLWHEHTQSCDDAFLDPIAGFNSLAESAAALDAWYRSEEAGPRPPGRLRPHRPVPVRSFDKWWARLVHKFLVDPDGRPRALRRAGRI